MIIGASGGIGHMAVQLAARMGARAHREVEQHHLGKRALRIH